MLPSTKEIIKRYTYVHCSVYLNVKKKLRELFLQVYKIEKCNLK